MSPPRTEILATLLEILSDAYLSNQNPGYATERRVLKRLLIIIG